MNISFTEMVQRKYDGKWILYGVGPDFNMTDDDRAYIERREKIGLPMVSKWVPIGIYDWNIELVKGEK